MLTLIVCALVAAVPAAADFQAGLRAYEQKDFAAALKEWQPLAEKGDSSAQYNLGLLYAKGEGVPQDLAKAAAWYEKAAVQGVAAAQYNLGLMYANGQGVPRDLQKAAQWYQKAAEQGVDGAANNLGTIFNEGEGAFRNFSEAEKWYRRGAEKGVASAQFNLGVMYDIGQGVPRNFAEAMKWYRQAAGQGLASAMTNVGILYYNAEGVKRDLVEAYAWFARAAERGDERGKALAESTMKKLRGGDRTKAEQLARNWQPKPVKVTESEQVALAAAESPAAARPLATPSNQADRATPPAPAAAVATGTAPTPAAPAAAVTTGATPAPTAVATRTTPAPAAPATGTAPALTEPPQAGGIQHTWTGVERIVAVGDVHGDYEQFFEALRSSGVIDRSGNWTGGRTHLVQTGDILDRGPDSRKVMDLLKHLEYQAKAAGGRVHVLLGNHEAMNLYGDLRYVSPGEIYAFSGAHSEEARRKLLPPDAPARPDPQWEAAHPPGLAELREAMSPTGYYGKWLAGKNAVIRINDTLFAHAGIGPKYADRSIGEINTKVREELHNLSKLHGGVVLDDQGPLWYRGMATAPEEELAGHVETVLKNFGVKRIVVGHSYANAAITPRWDGKVVLIDIGLPRVYDNLGKMGTLIIEDGAAYALHRGRKLKLPTDGGPALLDYLKQAAALDPSPSPLAGRISELEKRLGQ
jgi:TPR repeat protein